MIGNTRFIRFLGSWIPICFGTKDPQRNRNFKSKLFLGSEDLHFSPASFSAQNFGKFSSDHHETPSSSIVANKDDLESRDNVLEKSLRSNVAKFRFT